MNFVAHQDQVNMILLEIVILYNQLIKVLQQAKELI